MKLIVVTGSSGFVGARLVQLFREAGQTVLGIDLLPSDTTEVVSNIN